MAHQWFGDLVTMRWWDDIWLNEGFANWMESKPLEGVEARVAHGARRGRSKPVGDEPRRAATRRAPIRAKASTPAEISELFDPIAYEKGAAVLRMVEAWVGEEAFRKGVNAYIEKFKYGNARAEDFWGTLRRVTGKPVDKVMAGFVDQPGVPIVDASVTCNGSAGSILYFTGRSVHGERHSCSSAIRVMDDSGLRQDARTVFDMHGSRDCCRKHSREQLSRVGHGQRRRTGLLPCRLYLPR